MHYRIWIFFRKAVTCAEFFTRAQLLAALLWKVQPGEVLKTFFTPIKGFFIVSRALERKKKEKKNDINEVYHENAQTSGKWLAKTMHSDFFTLDFFKTHLVYSVIELIFSLANYFLD